MVRVAHCHQLAEIEQQVRMEFGVALACSMLIQQLVNFAENENILGLAFVYPLDNSLLKTQYFY